MEGVVRKHPAPEGALRLDISKRLVHALLVRKHLAPEGALRLHGPGSPGFIDRLVRKHPAPEGTLKRVKRCESLL